MSAAAFESLSSREYTWNAVIKLLGDDVKEFFGTEPYAQYLEAMENITYNDVMCVPFVTKFGFAEGGYVEGPPFASMNNPCASISVNEPSVVAELKKIFPGITNQTICPSCYEQRSVADNIMHLNDKHKWTREAIADWTETLPFSLEAKVE